MGILRIRKSFSEYIRNESVADDEMMVSFDVTSLYTNVPIKDTLIIVKDLLVNDPDLQRKTNIPAEDLLEITECLNHRNMLANMCNMLAECYEAP